MQDFIIQMMNQFGYVGVALLIAIENIFPPIPSEVILTFCGFMTTYTNLNLIGAVIFSTIGSLLGAVVLYGVGRALSPRKLEKWLDGRLGKLLHLKKEDVRRSQEWFQEKGNSAVFFCRFVPIVRSLISIPAGMALMDFGPFFLLTTIGSLIWNVVLISLGALMGEAWPVILVYLDQYSTIIWWVVILFLGYRLFRSWQKKRIQVVHR